MYLFKAVSPLNKCVRLMWCRVASFSLSPKVHFIPSRAVDRQQQQIAMTDYLPKEQTPRKMSFHKPKLRGCGGSWINATSFLLKSSFGNIKRKHITEIRLNSLLHLSNLVVKLQTNLQLFKASNDYVIYPSRD